jgi:hydroxymethylpyrimidine pyrophosphatase-like HAD family hydrolase
MRFSVLALDYDGTIAEDGNLNDQVRTAIGELQRRGITVILVTGRILSDLQRVAGDLRLFDAVVAENGAVLTQPASGRTVIIGQPVSADFLKELARRAIKATAGACVIEADASEAIRILPVIQEMCLPLVILFNRGRLMILSQAISKATGLREALTTLRLSAHNAVAIGDAENDHELLAACEMGVAVSWGSETLKASADAIIEGRGPSAVADYIKRIAEYPRLPPKRTSRRHLLLGHTADGQTLALAVRGRNVLICGDPKSGKSWIAGLLCEQLILHRYCVCIIDPEGEYQALESLPGVMVLDGGTGPPPLSEIARLLRYHDISVVVDLSKTAYEAKQRYVATLLQMLTRLRRQTGLPHRIVVDEAHYFLHDADVLQLLDLELAGYTLITYKASQLHREVLASSEAIIVTRETDPDEADAMLKMRTGELHEHWKMVLENLAIDEAVLFPGVEESGGELRKFQIAQRLTPHVRHRLKYRDVPVSEQKAFFFAPTSQGTERRARTLNEYSAIVTTLAQAELAGYLRRADFSRWIKKVFADESLASMIAEVEKRYRPGNEEEVRGAIVKLIEERYATNNERFFANPAVVRIG